IFAAYLSREVGRRLDEPHAIYWMHALVIRGIGREGFAPGCQFGYSEAYAIWICLASLRRLRVGPQADIDLAGDQTGQITGSHEMYNPSSDQLGLSFHAVQIVKRGSGARYSRHCTPPLLSIHEHELVTVEYNPASVRQTMPPGVVREQ